MVDLITVFFGLLLDADVGGFTATRFAARVPLTVVGELGIPSNAVRTALSRQIQRGMLVSERASRKVVYSLTDKCLQIIATAGARISAPDPFAATFATWTLASFSVPERRRELRNRLRVHLHRCGFRPLRDGLWVALNSFAAELALQDLDPDVINYCEFDVFIATPHGGTDLSELARNGWDIDDMRARHESFLIRWKDDDGYQLRALPLLMLFTADWVDLLKHDPGLPSEVVGPDWPAGRSAATAARMFAKLQTPAGAELAELLETIGVRR